MAPGAVGRLYERPAQVFVTGMSFGGSTAGITCQVDPACVAAVNMDGGNFEGTMFNTNARTPFMMFMNDWPVMFEQLGGEGTWDYSTFGFNDFSYERHAEAGLRDDFYRLRVKDIQHLGVSDFGLFARGIVRKAIFGDVDGHKMVTIINDFVVGFFDKYVRGVEGKPIADAFARHSDQVVEHKATAVSDWFNSKSEAEQAALEANKAATVVTLPIPGGKKAAKNPEATITFTTGETIALELFPDAAPQSVRNYIYLANQGFFDNGPIWRVENNGLIQGGAHSADGSDGAGYGVKGEFANNGIDNPTKFTPGTIGYGRVALNDGGGAYFITVTDMPRLDGNYAAFGRVTEGLELARQISRMEAEPIAEGMPIHRAVNPVTVGTIRVDTFGVEHPEPEKLPLPAPEELEAAVIAELQESMEKAKPKAAQE